jgi:phosphoserine phosphatase RsbU/P
MSYYSTFNQRDTFKLVQRLTSGKFKNEMALLQSLVRDIVEHKDFEIIGGRIWEFSSAESAYILRYQYGKVKKIPDGYPMSITNYPIITQLVKQRTILNVETDTLLCDLGIEVYSVTGVGEVIKHKGERYFKYALGFNAPQILQSFFETLTIISSVTTFALRELNNQLIHERMSDDLLKASDIQRNLLPVHSMEFHDYEIYGVCLPDSAVGGDYFDYIRQPDNLDERLSIVVSDCANKGLPAAIQALFVSGAIRMGMAFSSRISHLMARLNTLIFDTFPFERFVTLVYCELTLSSNRLVLYANAGHCSPIHYRPSLDNFKLLEPTGGLLGLVEEQRFDVENIRMHPGDILLLYTDGITEAQNKDDLFYGEERLCNIIRENHNSTPKEIAQEILQDVQTFSAESPYNDDKTLVVIKRKNVTESN